ncbi:Charged multivesicular body protein 4b [Holothuria leucospilota]|uniref:Charged multivesicular body protein 4b n=1 Tax=Holothuria leucospilota TaxID=206669 RepID=A0A9Q1CAY5_HOLLE|nr:Charged multivesicular body protein 4b [Holothuria leucospilota]
MSRFFRGGKTKEVGTSSAEGIQKMKGTEEMLTKKEELLVKQIVDQTKIARQNAAKRNKRASMNSLKKKKKKLEKHLQQIDDIRSTIELHRAALGNAITKTEVLKNRADAVMALRNAFALGVEAADNMMADIQEQIKLASQVLSKPPGFGQDVDEDDLMAELEELEQEEFDQKMQDVDVELPEPFAWGKKKEKSEDDDLRKLQAWAS